MQPVSIRLALLSAIALNLARSPAAAQAPRLEFERLVGCALCEGPEAFASIQSVTLAEDGTIIVTDARPPMLRLLEPGGKITALGREGDGPGEMRLPLTAFPQSDGGLLVVDLRQKRITRFDPHHEVVSVAPLGAFPAGAGYAAATDRLLLTTTDFRGGLALLEWSPEGTLDTVLTRLPFLDDRGMRFVAPAVRSDGGFAFGDGEAVYRINVYGPDATLERSITRDLKRRPRTREELEAMRTRRMGGRGRAAAEGGDAREAEIDPLQPHFYNLNALEFDDAGRLWVRTARALSGRTAFDVFSPDGTFIGPVTVDRDVGPYAVRGDRLVGVVRDAHDVARIATWRIL